MKLTQKRRLRLIASLIVIVVSYASVQSWINPTVPVSDSAELTQMYSSAEAKLNNLAVKGRAPSTGYERAQFGDGWDRQGACDMRNIILNRDLKDVVVDEDCRVMEGVLTDPYTGKTVKFTRGASSSSDVQIDHVVALSDAWQKGAQSLSYEDRVRFANDPQNLLAVDGASNQAKSDGDAATWLPPNKAFRCQYVSRQVEVKAKYSLWVTPAEKQAILRVIQSCL